MKIKTAGKSRWLLIVCAAVCILMGLWIGNVVSGGAQQEEASDVSDEEVTTFVSGVVTNENGDAVTASVEVTDLSDNSKIREQTDILGRYEIELPLGEYELVFSKGFEYERKSVEVSLSDRLRAEQEPVVLKRTVNWHERGWYCGDLHQHTIYSDGYQAVEDVFISDMANGLDFGFITDHNATGALLEWERAGSIMDGDANEPFITIPGTEVTTEDGHYNSLGSSALIDYDVSDGADDIQRISDEIKAAGGIAQVNHPFLTDGMGFTKWELIDSFDTYEIWNGKGVTNEDANLQAKEKWFDMLNDGLYLPATGGSDNHDITGNYPWRRDNESEASKMWIDRGLYSGMPRNYVYCPDGADAESILQAIKSGNNFITNGPLIDFKINGAIPGESTAAVDKAELSLKLYDQRGLDSAVLIENGKVIEEFSVSGMNEQEITVNIPVNENSWYVVEVTGAEGGYAITNPVFSEDYPLN